jgi:imidazolonepropionase-like amidohydrolase
VPIGANARDIEHFVTLLGFTPMEAILAATKLGGEIMGRPEVLYFADLLLVDGDPLQDVGVLAQRDKLRLERRRGPARPQITCHSARR